MKDIANKAGVSASTVCRALRSDTQIAEKTQQKVRAIAKSMGYVPDPLLSAFAMRRRGRTTGTEATTIAYVTNFASEWDWKRNSYYSRMHGGAFERAAQLGYNLEHFWLGEPGMTGKRLSKILYNRGVSALFVAPTPQVRGHLSLEWSRFASIAVGYSLLRPNLHRVCNHHFHGMLTAVRELRRAGYTKIGFSAFRETSKRVDEQWLAAFLICQKFLTGTHFAHFLFDDQTVDAIPAWCRKERLEVVIGGEPTVLAELKRGGMFPDQVDYATESWEEGTPQVAGLDQRPDAIGATAIDLVVAQLQRGERGIPVAPSTTMVEGRWREGASLRRLRSGNRRRTAVYL